MEGPQQERVGRHTRLLRWAVNKIFQGQLWILGFFSRHTPKCITDRANSNLYEENRQLKQDKKSLTNAGRTLQNQKDDIHKRLSEIMSSRLRDNNPNIVDLSDEYRPNKLAEFSGELYDNEWTDACYFLEKMLDDCDEQEIIQHLLNILMEIHTTCKRIYTDHWTAIVYHLTWGQSQEEDYKEMLKAIKDMNKERAMKRLTEVKKQCLDALKTIQPFSAFCDQMSYQCLGKYVEGCVKLCWLMQVQDPPVVLVCSGWETKQRRHDDSASKIEDRFSTEIEQGSSIQQRNYQPGSNYNNSLNSKVNELQDRPLQTTAAITNNVCAICDNDGEGATTTNMSDTSVLHDDQCNEKSNADRTDDQMEDSGDNDEFGSVGSSPNSDTDSNHEDDEQLKHTPIIEMPLTKNDNRDNLKMDAQGNTGTNIEIISGSKDQSLDLHLAERIEDGMSQTASKEDIDIHIVSTKESNEVHNGEGGMPYSEEVPSLTRDKTNETTFSIINESCKTDMPSEGQHIQTDSPVAMPFQHDLFREYTKRGPAIEYIVWPVMYLYDGGPVLHKGVAQGGEI